MKSNIYGIIVIINIHLFAGINIFRKTARIAESAEPSRE